MRDAIYITVICLLVTFIVVNHIGRPIKQIVPLTYSSTQIDDLIAHNTLLTNILAEQLEYEKDVAKNCH